MIAVTQDVGASGLLVLSQRALVAGQSLTLYLLFGGVQHVLTGKILRQEPLAHDERSLWRSKAALVFDDGNPDLAKILAALSDAA